MSRRLDISRRDFLGGVALATASGAVPPIEALAGDPASGAYPPALMGMRGWGGVDVRHSAPGDHVDVCYVRGAIASSAHEPGTW